MFYHDMGRSKAGNVGMAHNMEVKTVGEEKAEEWVKILSRDGMREGQSREYGVGSREFEVKQKVKNETDQS